MILNYTNIVFFHYFCAIKLIIVLVASKTVYFMFFGLYESYFSLWAFVKPTDNKGYSIILFPGNNVQSLRKQVATKADQLYLADMLSMFLHQVRCQIKQIRMPS